MGLVKVYCLVCVLLGVLMGGCDDEVGDRNEYECGFSGNGCWSDGTCNTGLACNVKRKSEELGDDVCPATYGVCEAIPDGSTPVPDSAPPDPDGTTDGVGTDGVMDIGSDTGVPDTAVSDTASTH